MNDCRYYDEEGTRGYAVDAPDGWRCPRCKEPIVRVPTGWAHAASAPPPKAEET